MHFRHSTIVLPLLAVACSIPSVVDGYVHRFSSKVLRPAGLYVEGRDAAINGKSPSFSGGNSSTNSRGLTRALFPIFTSLVIGSFSAKEILELGLDQTRKIGHAHSMGILASMSLVRSLAQLETQAEEFNEVFEKVVTVEWRPLVMFWKLILRPSVALVVSGFAFVAAVFEIVQDMGVGGHHGAALLSLSEGKYQLDRFQTNRRLKRGANKNLRQKPKTTLTLGYLLGFLIPVLAASFALYEMYGDLKPGAHHGVAILALAECVESVRRVKILT